MLKLRKIIALLLIFTITFSLSDAEPCLANTKAPKISLKKSGDLYYLTWTSIPEADGYEVRAATKKNGKYKKVASVTVNSYDSYKLITRGKRYYKIVPYENIFKARVFMTPSKAKKVNLKDFKLSVEHINQYPTLPTGCEATALTMAINYHGFKVSTETIARDYMPKQSAPGNFYLYFLGNPFSESGLGIYSPGLARTGNNYLSTQNTKLAAYNITGASLKTIRKYVAKGYPVCIWTTYSLNKDPGVNSSWKYKGQKFVWKTNEHCMTVIGFNIDQNTIIVADPARGIMEHPASLINKRYKQYDKMSVVIK